jgi:hypothetical protein
MSRAGSASGGRDSREPHDLNAMLDNIEEAASDTERVSFGDVFKAVGRRSFGPLLLLVGLVILAPVVGDIPGVPTMMSIVLVLIAVQMLMKRDHFWLPRWLLDRSMAAAKVRKGVGWLRKPARFVDRMLRPRLTKLVTGTRVYGIALIAVAIGLMTPAMEIVPFSANGAGAVLTAFGLSLIARDGLMALVALVMAALTAGVVVWGIAGV